MRYQQGRHLNSLWLSDAVLATYRQISNIRRTKSKKFNIPRHVLQLFLLSGVPDYFYRNKISSGGDLSHYSSASLY